MELEELEDFPNPFAPGVPFARALVDLAEPEVWREWVCACAFEKWAAQLRGEIEAQGTHADQVPSSHVSERSNPGRPTLDVSNRLAPLKAFPFLTPEDWSPLEGDLAPLLTAADWQEWAKESFLDRLDNGTLSAFGRRGSIEAPLQQIEPRVARYLGPDRGSRLPSTVTCEGVRYDDAFVLDALGVPLDQACVAYADAPAETLALARCAIGRRVGRAETPEEAEEHAVGLWWDAVGRRRFPNPILAAGVKPPAHELALARLTVTLAQPADLSDGFLPILEAALASEFQKEKIHAQLRGTLAGLTYREDQTLLALRLALADRLRAGTLLAFREGASEPLPAEDFAPGGRLGDVDRWDAEPGILVRPPEPPSRTPFVAVAEPSPAPVQKKGRPGRAPLFDWQAFWEEGERYCEATLKEAPGQKITPGEFNAHMKAWAGENLRVGRERPGKKTLEQKLRELRAELGTKINGGRVAHRGGC